MISSAAFKHIIENLVIVNPPQPKFWAFWQNYCSLDSELAKHTYMEQLTPLEVFRYKSELWFMVNENQQIQNRVSAGDENDKISSIRDANL